MRLRTWAGRLIAVFGLVCVFGLVTAPAVSAETGSSEVPVGDAITLSDAGVRIVVGLLLPFLLGVVMRGPAGVKAIGGIVAAALANLVIGAVRDDGSAVISWATVLETALVYVPQILSYLGVWQPVTGGTFNERVSRLNPLSRGAPLPRR